VYAHGKGLLVTLPCAHARQRRYVTTACAPGNLGVCLEASLPCGLWCRRTAKLPARHRAGARQRLRLTAKPQRTAVASRTAKHTRRAKGRRAAAPCRTVKPLAAWQSTLARQRGLAHDKAFAVQYLRRARQRWRCRRILCRANVGGRPRTTKTLPSIWASLPIVARQCPVFP
jgi:hypothetical protein